MWMCVCVWSRAVCICAQVLLYKQYIYLFFCSCATAAPVECCGWSRWYSDVCFFHFFYASMRLCAFASCSIAYEMKWSFESPHYDAVPLRYIAIAVDDGYMHCVRFSKWALLLLLAISNNILAIHTRRTLLEQNTNIRTITQPDREHEDIWRRDREKFLMFI